MPTLRITFLNGQAAGQQQRFDRFPILIGRSPESSLTIAWDEKVSRAHARVRQTDRGLILEDVQSRNGTFVDGARLDAAFPLIKGKAILQVGETELQLEVEGVAIEMDGLPTAGKPSRELCEAVMAFDLCDSTVIANRYGDEFALQLKEAIRALVRPILTDRGVAFLKGTGDGFLATFSDPRRAVEAAVAILQQKGAALPPTSDGTPPTFRVGIHFGPTKVDSDGDRQGDVVNMAFRLESASTSGFHQTHDGIDQADLALQDRIFLSEHAHDELQKRAAFPARLVGFFDLKGIAGRHRIFEVLWREIDLAGLGPVAGSQARASAHRTLPPLGS
jgi:class 3 adenylate cyclase